LIILCGLILQIFSFGGGLGFFIQVMTNFVFLAVVFACLYAIIQSVLGKYAEIPTLSDAVYSQVR